MSEFELSFAEAVTEMDNGNAVQQQGWNGKGMFCYKVDAGNYEPVTSVAKAYFKNQKVPYGAYYALKTAADYVVPWQPSQTDMSNGNWRVINLAEFSDK